jgi:hypothetical protein
MRSRLMFAFGEQVDWVNRTLFESSMSNSTASAGKLGFEDSAQPTVHVQACGAYFAAAGSHVWHFGGS